MNEQWLLLLLLSLYMTFLESDPLIEQTLKDGKKE